LRILYFAWLRAKIGTAREDVSPPADVTTVGALMEWLAASRPGFAEALAASGVIRAAVNQDYAQPGDPVRPDDEVAFFPPVTGG
jgi:molybdopterin synthase sulfur carrier subunit